VPPPKDLPHVLTDAGALKRIVSSLVENAMKYTPEKGQVEVSATNNGERIAVEIIDTGCGIRSEDLPRIYEKFYRGKPLAAGSSPDEDLSDETGCDATSEAAGGVGLGLYLVRNLVEQIGGEIMAESPVAGKEGGTKFTVLLPVSDVDVSDI
jgi:signal transduction histidine kinase